MIALATAIAWGRPTVVVGSKRDVEGNVLAELFAQVAEREGEVDVERRANLGGTGLVLAALESGDIDLYPEYTGTLLREVLHEDVPLDLLPARMAERGILVGPLLGFDNTYAIAVRGDSARTLGLRSIGDLARHPELTGGFSPEFVSGPVRWSTVADAYGLPVGEVRTLEHAIAYAALSSGAIDLTDAYTTDGSLAGRDLVLLVDDRHAIPSYQGLALAKLGFEERHPRTWAALSRLGGRLDEGTMRQLNARAELDRVPYEVVVREFLDGARSAAPTTRMLGPRILTATVEHVLLTLGSVVVSMLVGVPLGALVSRRAGLSRAVVGLTGLLQTVPSIALLCILVPWVGIGAAPAGIALVAYALFPLVSGTVNGLRGVDARLLEVAEVLGMTPLQRFLRVEWPLALPSVLAGVEVAAVTSVGTATLAAFVGGGGYGALVSEGLALNDPPLILAGAIPAALLAVAVHLAVHVVGRRLR